MNGAEVLRYGHESVLRHVEGLSEEEWHTPGVCGVWSVKEIVAHLASFELLLVDVLNTIVDNGVNIPVLMSLGALGIERFNNDEVAKRKDDAYIKVLTEYNLAHDEVMTLIAKVPVETRRKAGTLPWYGPEYDLEDYICYSNYAHKREHCAQIAVFRDVLKTNPR